MIIQVNESNEIIGYSIAGCIKDAIEVDDKVVPDGFFESFKSKYYLYQNNEIVVNPNYKEPIITDPSPSQTQQQLAQVTYQQMMTTQDVTTLQTQNAQMAYQLMMQQGGKE